MRDPIDLSPEAFRELGHRAVDLLAEQLAALARPDALVRRPLPEVLRRRLLEEPPPAEPCDPAALLERVRTEVLPHPMGNASPRFFAWVNSPPAPFAVVAELLAAGLDPSVAGGDHAATYVEHAALGWIASWLGYPQGSGGLLTSGGSVANLIGLAVMRSEMAEGDVRADGLAGEARAMTIYTSAAGHSCLQKAVELLGFGSRALRRLPVDAEQRLDVSALESAVLADRAAGLRPVCVAASAGTVDTGAVDPLEPLADLCEREGLWLHVDGSYGAFGILAEQTGGAAGLFRGLARADSLAVDPHKWLYVPLECGCALVRDSEAMRRTFSLVPAYLRDDAALPWFSEYGIQQSRGFRALKLWLLLQQVGEQGYRASITRDVARARSLQARIRSREGFELLSAGPLGVTCFRWAPPGAADLDALNRRLLDRLQREGRVYLTSTRLDGCLALRACIVNFRTSEADLERLLEEVERAGSAELASG